MVVVATPTWMGHHSSVCQRVLERLYAELSETDSEGRLLTFGKVAVVVVVGNEDGAHKISADLFQALNDVGFTIAAQGVTYRNGPAMQTTDYQDLSETPKETASATRAAAANAVHLASLLRSAPYPAPSGGAIPRGSSVWPGTREGTGPVMERTVQGASVIERPSGLSTHADGIAGDAGRALALARDIGREMPLPGTGRTGRRWTQLREIGAADLTAARVVEAHADALAILAEARDAGFEVRTGADDDVWGVFAAEGPGVRVEASPAAGRWVLHGTKPWCSLADRLDRALITA
ncbi:MAG TPA: hypothetical protein VIU11_25750, partial [Nakamurella sp.]